MVTVSTHVKTPRTELARLRQEQVGENPEVRTRIMDAMLLCCGEQGFRRVSVEKVCHRYGGYRSQFYRYFTSKTDCFLAAYESATEDLSGRLLRCADSEEAWPGPVRAALEELAAFIEGEQPHAKALFVEVHVAAGQALRRRQEMLERLSRALDQACREDSDRHSAPSITGEFMVSAIDQAVSNALLTGKPEEFADAVPDLVALISHAYRGEGAPLV